MQLSEKRKNLRRSITYPAFIDLGDGSPVRECALCDASQDGAQLQVAEPDKVPDEFTLALSSDGAARRKCRVVWRTTAQIGVEFVKERTKSQRGMTPLTRASYLKTSGGAAQEGDEIVHKVDIDTLSSQ
jgi:PilZ domain